MKGTTVCTTGDGSLWYKLKKGPAFTGLFLFVRPVPGGATKEFKIISFLMAYSSLEVKRSVAV